MAGDFGEGKEGVDVAALRLWQSIDCQACPDPAKIGVFLLRGVMSNPAMKGRITKATVGLFQIAATSDAGLSNRTSSVARLPATVGGAARWRWIGW